MHPTKSRTPAATPALESLPVHRLRRPKLGQHFLHDTRYLARIAAALAILPPDLVVEIGPGRGAMTERLAARARRLIAIEIDPVLARELRAKFARDSRIEIVTADFLTVNLSALCREHGSGQCWVFGNLPYYITSPIIHHLLDYVSTLRGMALLVQREVAQRLTAAPGSRAYGYLSVLAQFHSRPRLVLGVPPGAFQPPPKIHSSLVDFQMTSPPPRLPPSAREMFLQFVKDSFASKRKKLLNNLAKVYTRERVQQALGSLKLDFQARAEQLSVEEFVALFQSLSLK